MLRILVQINATILLFLQIAGAQQLPAKTAGSNGSSAKMHLLSPYFLFKSDAAPRSTLNQDKSKDRFPVTEKRAEGFTIKAQVDFHDFTGDQLILEVPDIISVRLKQADPTVRDRQNYPAFTMPGGAVPVLEATITLASPAEKVFERQMTIGFPLAALANPWGHHEMVLNFTGPRWTIYIDGQIMDNDFAIGYPQWREENEWQIETAYVSQAAISLPAMKAERDNSKSAVERPDVQYWTPRWHNAWVGDVATLYHDGRYHVFYLFDRRHHASKFGVGGHYFEHFSTADFKTWTEHEAAVPIDDQWETIGTGTPFAFKDRLYIAYGMHTSRIYPKQMTMTPLQKSYYEQHGRTGAFPFDLSTAYPSGATYSVSANGLDDFRKSKIQFHFSENPSVYIDPEGKLKMIANYGSKGLWASDALDSGWHCLSPDFPPGGDCTFFFRWGRFDYIIGGFEQLYTRPVNGRDTAWTDMVTQGRDFYNGIDVPAITKISDGRYLMAGWFPIRNGWGGPFVVHELIQKPDGRIRTKWMKELIPATKAPVPLARQVEKAASFAVKDSSFIITFDVYPKKSPNARLAVSFLSAGKKEYDNACELQIRTGQAVAQYGPASKDSFSVPQPSLKQGGHPQNVGNYAIEHLTGVDKPFQVRILIKSSPKLGGTIVDTEIAGQNTMISYRQGLNIGHISFNLQETQVRNIKVMKIEN